MLPEEGAMLGLGLNELIFIFLIVLVLFGATRLPQLGRGLGEGISNFRRGLRSSTEEPPADDDQGKKHG